jgi:hypothetical protein
MEGVSDHIDPETQLFASPDVPGATRTTGSRALESWVREPGRKFPIELITRRGVVFERLNSPNDLSRAAPAYEQEFEEGGGCIDLKET